MFARTVVRLSGFDGAPGVNVFNWMGVGHLEIGVDAVNDFHERLNTALSTCTSAAWASGVTWWIDPAVSLFEVETEELIGALTGEVSTYTMTGSGGGGEVRAAQLGVRWQTQDFRYGRRIAGRTYLGPIGSALIGADGKITADVLSTFPDNFDDIISSDGPRLIVYSRPRAAQEDPPVAARAGDFADVTGTGIAPFPFILRGRRD
jgi:hypothetical protein